MHLDASGPMSAGVYCMHCVQVELRGSNNSLVEDLGRTAGSIELGTESGRATTSLVRSSLPSLKRLSSPNRGVLSSSSTLVQARAWVRSFEAAREQRHSFSAWLGRWEIRHNDFPRGTAWALSMGTRFSLHHTKFSYQAKRENVVCIDAIHIE